MPHTILMSVVFPAPLGPRSAKISPLRISRSIGFSACSPEAYVFVRPEMEMIGAIAASLSVDASGAGSGWKHSRRKHRGHRGPQRPERKEWVGFVHFGRHCRNFRWLETLFGFLCGLCGPLCPLCFRL